MGGSGLVCGTHDTARRAVQAGLPVFITAATQAVSDAVNEYWARFALTGTPNGPGSPATWPGFAPDANDDERLQLDSGWETIDDFRKTECTFWRQQYDQAIATQ